MELYLQQNNRYNKILFLLNGASFELQISQKSLSKVFFFKRIYRRRFELIL